MVYFIVLDLSILISHSFFFFFYVIAGFSVIGLADINPGAQLVYIIAMYISVYPVAISMRNSNIYQVKKKKKKQAKLDGKTYLTMVYAGTCSGYF